LKVLKGKPPNWRNETFSGKWPRIYISNYEKKKNRSKDKGKNKDQNQVEDRAMT
jgi:hypothetical protein